MWIDDCVCVRVLKLADKDAQSSLVSPMHAEFAVRI